ncbi:MAG: hypothetical protein ACYCYA_13835 [Actinomycetes bacterium]
MGSYRLGLRVDDPAILDTVRDVLGEHLVDDPEAPANFSIRWETAAGQDGDVRQLVLYEDWWPVSWSTSITEIVADLGVRLAPAVAGPVPLPGPPDSIVLGGVVLMVDVDGRAAIVPDELRILVMNARGPLAASGICVVPPAWIVLDVGSGPRVRVLPGLDAQPVRRWRLAGVVVADSPATTGNGASRSLTARAVATLVRAGTGGRSPLAAGQLAEIAHALDAVPVVGSSTEITRWLDSPGATVA